MIIFNNCDYVFYQMLKECKKIYVYMLTGNYLCVCILMGDYICVYMCIYTNGWLYIFFYCIFVLLYILLYIYFFSVYILMGDYICVYMIPFLVLKIVKKWYYVNNFLFFAWDLGVIFLGIQIV